MNYQHLIYFREIATGKTFQQAADTLYVTQSTLSRAISSLEDELGVKLFEKNGRSVKITPYGAKFLEYIDVALNTIDEGIKATISMAGRIDGTLKISCIYGYTYHYLPLNLIEFEKEFPEVYFMLQQTTSQGAIIQVHNGEADIAIHCESSLMKKYTDLEYHHLISQEIVVIVPANHRLAHKSSVYLHEIANDDFVGFCKDSGILYKTEDMFHEAGLEYHPSIVASDDQTVMNLVRTGSVIAVVLENITRHCDNIKVLKILDDIDKTMPIYFATRKSGSKSAALEMFKDFLFDTSGNRI